MKLDADDLEVAWWCATIAIRTRRENNQPIPEQLRRHLARLDLAIGCTSNPAGFADETNSITSQPQSTHDDLIDAAQAAAIIGRSAQWVRRIHADLDGQFIAGRWLFPRRVVETYAQERISP